MRLEAILICDKVVREDNGKIHLQGIFNRIFAPKIPAIHQEMYLFFRFSTDLKDREDRGNDVLRFELIHPDGTAERLPTPKPVVGNTGQVKGIVRLLTFPLRHWGRYLFRLYFNEIEVGLSEFELSRIKIEPTVEDKDGTTIQ